MMARAALDNGRGGGLIQEGRYPSSPLGTTSKAVSGGPSRIARDARAAIEPDAPGFPR